MKVLKKPDFSDWVHRFHCGNCDAELEAEPDDLIYVFSSGYGREPDCETYQVKCSVCDTPHTVPFNTIPKILQIHVKEKSQRRSSNYFDR
jgi:hypothetical protein